MRSVTSGFIFRSYKIDTFSFEMAKELNFLEKSRFEIPDSWQYRVVFRKPSFFKDAKIYIGGLEFDMRLLDEQAENPEEKDPIFILHAGITGSFAVEEGRFEPSVEEKMIKYHIPSLLMPHLRSAVSCFLATAGFGSVVLPLLNIHSMAKDAGIEIDIE